MGLKQQTTVKFCKIRFHTAVKIVDCRKFLQNLILNGIFSSVCRTKTTFSISYGTFLLQLPYRFMFSIFIRQSVQNLPYKIHFPIFIRQMDLHEVSCRKGKRKRVSQQKTPFLNRPLFFRHFALSNFPPVQQYERKDNEHFCDQCADQGHLRWAVEMVTGTPEHLVQNQDHADI